jgi:diguanylate cyclase (GGDEF)-like protein
MTGWQTVAFPFALSLTVLGVLAVREVHPVNHVATSLALASVLAIIARMTWALRDNTGLLTAARQEAQTDPLTGLGNRRALVGDLDAVVSRAAEVPHVLVLFDLDGFKTYNDTFGHPAGDALLARRGRALRATVTGRGRAYRPGGDEFCVLLRGTVAETARLVEDCEAALSECTERSCIGASWGACAVPAEAPTVGEALRVADERMYAHKAARRGPGRGDALAA